MCRTITLLLAALLAACSGGPPLLRAGGQYSGVPDGTVGDWRRPQGTISTGGVIQLNRELPPRL